MGDGAADFQVHARFMHLVKYHAAFSLFFIARFGICVVQRIEFLDENAVEVVHGCVNAVIISRYEVFD